MTRAIRTLLDGLVDYAGLFPPSAWPMQRCVETYARDRMGEHAWMLGRFICPASRLEELSACGAQLMPGTHATSGYREMADTLEPWKISVVCDMPVPDALEAMTAFDARHAHETGGLAKADAIEIRAAGVGVIDEALDVLPEDVYPFFEVPTDVDPRGHVAALSGDSAAGKIRCGGVTADAIPPGRAIAAFIHACVQARVPFKATAGLHHPVRAEHALTYEDDAPRGTMHGYMNVFLASALVHAGRLSVEETGELLDEVDPKSFKFNDEGASWRDRSVSVIEISDARERFALSYGSCSFSEPVRDAKALGWL